MHISLLHLLGSSSWHRYLPLAAAGVLSWGIWIYRVVSSTFMKPVVTDFSTTTSVVVPAFREDPDVLERCLESWLAQGPTEVIVVPDVADVEVIERLVRASAEHAELRVLPFRHSGKRSALGHGMRAATGEILVLSDSDTSWLPGLLAAIQMPFADPSVGGVGTQQSVYERTGSVWRRTADWLLSLRYNNYVPAMARKGAVSCLSGRTVAYRAAAVIPVIAEMENEVFLGRKCISGDDGRLTWLVLSQGYKCTHQSSARAESVFPDDFRTFIKQRVRWSRNSYRTYLTAIYNGWLWSTPLVTRVTVAQIMLTPITIGLTLYFLLTYRLDFSNLTTQAVTASIASMLVARGIRGSSHLIRHPGEIVLLPLMTVVAILIALPVKGYAMLTMNKQGWLTRGATSPPKVQPAPAV
ncbi:MAG TPA: glycosyltransferase [Mycobacteriales bacterium]|nr:glycosyltransferase [Mycobacteriales bacterium]